MLLSPSQLLRSLFDVAIASANPLDVLAPHLPAKPQGRCIVVGAGKASAQMAAALEAAWPDVPMQGVVVTRDGHAVPTRGIEILEASHPVPDARSEEAAHRMMAAVKGLGPNDLVIALISGGGSATLALPAGDLSMEDKIAVHRQLLNSGAPVGEMNVVRSALSGIKAGRLAAAAAPAKVVTLVISDVPGDDPRQIASGPTLGSPPSRARAREIVSRHGLQLPPAVTAFLEQEDQPVTLAEDDARIIAAPFMALQAAADLARKHGITPIILGDAIEGEAREVAKVMAAIAVSVRTNGTPIRAPAVILSGGETSVTIGSGTAGRGGRNTEFLLSLAVALNGAEGIWALAGDTDGIDGSEDAAGAVVSPDSLARGRASGVDAATMLAGHDSYSFFSATGDLVVTGPTHTNVNDFRAILVA